MRFSFTVLYENDKDSVYFLPHMIAQNKNDWDLNPGPLDSRTITLRPIEFLYCYLVQDKFVSDKILVF